MFPFEPKHRLGHPESNLLSLSLYKKNPDQSIQIRFDLILKTEALISHCQGCHGVVTWRMRHPVLSFSQLNNIFFGYFDPEKNFWDNENK